MTTLTINLPDDSKDIISAISAMVNKAGGDVSVYLSNDEDLSEAEFEALKLSYKEALLIKGGKAKGFQVSELWND